MDINFTSPVRIINTAVLGASFSIDDEAEEIGDFAALTISCTITDPDPNIPAPNCKRILDITCEWYENQESHRKTCEANCKLGIVVAYEQALGYHLVQSEIDDYLNTQAIEIAYSKIRTYIEAMTAESPIGKFTLPVIDAGEYVRSIEAQQMGRGQN